MESDSLATEKILKYLCKELEGHSSLDLIIAGIFIAEDYAKMEKVSKLVKNARQLMDQHSLKREHESILFEEMIHKLYKIQDGKTQASAEAVPQTSESVVKRVKKADMKFAAKINEHQDLSTKDKDFVVSNGAIQHSKEEEKLPVGSESSSGDNEDTSNSYTITKLEELK